MEKLTARKKAEMTYNMLQKRRAKKAKYKKKMVDEVVAQSFKRCARR
ncbi:hypothetical protein ACFHWD_14470 [Clostridium sp. MT-14]